MIIRRLARFIGRLLPRVRTGTTPAEVREAEQKVGEARRNEVFTCILDDPKVFEKVRRYKAPCTCTLGHWHSGRGEAARCDGRFDLAFVLIGGMIGGVALGTLVGVGVGASLFGWHLFSQHQRWLQRRDMEQALAAGKPAAPPHPATLEFMAMIARDCANASLDDSPEEAEEEDDDFEEEDDDFEMEAERARSFRERRRQGDLEEQAQLARYFVEAYRREKPPGATALRAWPVVRFARLLERIGSEGREKFRGFYRPDAWWRAVTCLVFADALTAARTVTDVPRIVALDRRLQSVEARQFHAAALVAAEAFASSRDLGAFCSLVEHIARCSTDEADFFRDPGDAAGIALDQWYGERLRTWDYLLLEAEPDSW